MTIYANCLDFERYQWYKENAGMKFQPVFFALRKNGGDNETSLSRICDQTQFFERGHKILTMHINHKIKESNKFVN